MRKFLICDDKVNRQRLLLGDNIDSLTNNPNVMIRYDVTELDTYINSCDIIAIHSSLLGSVNDVSIFLNNHKKELETKYFILFSGSEPEWRHDSDHLVFLNVVDFYSSSLLPFIESVCKLDNEVSFLKFHYGETNQLPLIVELKHKLWLNNIQRNYNFEESIDQVCTQLGLDAYDSNLQLEIDCLYNTLIQQI